MRDLIQVFNLLPFLPSFGCTWILIFHEFNLLPFLPSFGSTWILASFLAFVWVHMDSDFIGMPGQNCLPASGKVDAMLF